MLGLFDGAAARYLRRCLRLFLVSRSHKAIQPRGVHMNARTLIITAGAIVALAAPAVASAKLSPAWQYQKNLAAKKHAAKHAKQVFKRQGQSRQIYTYYPAPGLPQQQSLQ